MQRLKEPAGFAKVRFPNNNDPYWSVPKTEPRHLWKDAGAHSLRGLVRSDPFANDLRRYVLDLEGALAPFLGFQRTRSLTAPLREMIASLNRRRVAAMNR